MTSCSTPRKGSRREAQPEVLSERGDGVDRLANREWRLRDLVSKHRYQGSRLLLTVSSNTVVPNDDCSRSPLDSGLDVL